MARFVVKNRVDRLDGLKDFAEEGYGFRPDMSDDDRLLFCARSALGGVTTTTTAVYRVSPPAWGGRPKAPSHWLS